MPILNSRKLKLSKEEREKFEAIAKDITERFNEVNLAPLHTVQESVRKIAESFAPPAGLIEAFKQIGEQQTKMVQSLASIGFPKVDTDLYPLKSEVVIGLIKPRSEYLLEYQNQLLEKLIEKQGAKIGQKPYEYYPETKTFVTRVVVCGAINFSTKSGANSMSLLFEIFYKILEERGEIENGFKVVFVTAGEIIQRAIDKGKKDVDTNWLKHTRSNLINSKIPQELREIITISEFDNQRKGYYFKVRVGDYLIN